MPNGNGEGSQLPLWLTRSLIAILLGIVGWVAVEWHKRVSVMEAQILAHVTKGDLAVLATQQCEIRLDRMERIYKEMFEKVLSGVPGKPFPKRAPGTVPYSDDAY